MEQNPFDPFSVWKQIPNDWMELWSKVINDVVASEAFAKTMGEYLNTCLKASAPIRSQIEEAMEKGLHQMNVPTRKEVMQIGERLTNLEMRMDDLEAKVDEILGHLKEIKEGFTKGTSE